MKKTVILVVLILMVGGMTNSFADTINLSHMDLLFKEVREAEGFKKDLYANLLGDVFDNDEILENFASSYTDYLPDDDLEKIEKAGIKSSDIKESIRALKTWSFSDRMKLVDYALMEDQEKAKEKIEALNQKYAKESKEDEEVSTEPTDNTSSSSNSQGSNISTSVVEEDKVEVTFKKRLENKGLISKKIDIKKKKTFKDMDTHWSKSYVDFFASRGVISGRTENTYEPDGLIKESEIIKLLAEVTIQDQSKIDTTAINISEAYKDKWYAESIKQMKALNVIGQDKNVNTLYPEEYPTREKVIQLLVDTLYILELDLSDNLKEYKGSFSDFDQVDDKYKEAVIVANNLDIIQGNENGTLTPKRTITRGEVAKILKKFYEIVLDRVES